MTVLALLENGAVMEIPGVRWSEKEGLWVETAKVVAKIRQFNEIRKKWNVSPLLPEDPIEIFCGTAVFQCAEAPLKVFDVAESGEPETGLMRAEIPYGLTYDFWNDHA